MSQGVPVSAGAPFRLLLAGTIVDGTSARAEGSGRGKRFAVPQRSRVRPTDRELFAHERGTARTIVVPR